MKLNSNENIYKDLLDTLNCGKKAVMIRKLNYIKEKDELLKSEILLTEEDLTKNNSLKLQEDLYEQAQNVLQTGKLEFITNEDESITTIEPYFPEPKLVVLGGGHIAKPLVEFAAKVGFSVTVVDDRPSFANTARFPHAEKVICESFENCFKLLNINSSSFVVIVTRGHRNDMHCLKETLNRDTTYVGMIGSKRRVKIIREQLLSEGYSEEKINKINAPIGLDINAVSPEEIAISILAQLIRYKRSIIVSSGNSTIHKVNYLEYDNVIVEELAKGIEEPKAIVTIVSTKGSVPRRAGARMLVYADGRILGSIGGGCSEGEIINTARDIIREGGYKFQDIDMTGDAAEEEGMVCGGIMKVFIEKLVP